MRPIYIKMLILRYACACVHACVCAWILLLISSHQSLNREGRWGTTDDFATSFLHFSLFSTALWDLANSRPFHSLMLSSHLFLCLPCLPPPSTVPGKTAVVWSCLPFIRSGPSHVAGHSGWILLIPLRKWFCRTHHHMTMLFIFQTFSATQYQLENRRK